MKPKNKKFGKNVSLAQAASELAVFGAIFVFIVGLIMRTGLGASHQMNARLRALRMALTMSYRGSENYYGDNSVAARNNASVFILEDRLTTSAEKLGTRDRTPIAAAGSGVMTKNLYYPTDYGEPENLPIYDVFLNGQHFPFTIGAHRQYELATAAGGKPDWIPDCPNNRTFQTPPWNPPYGLCWAPQCFYTYAMVAGGAQDFELDVYTGQWISVPAGTGTHYRARYDNGCTLMFTIIGNHKGQEDPVFCDADPCAENLPAQGAGGRFDLDRDGNNLLESSSAFGALAPNFMWQWALVPGVHDNHISDINSAGIRTALGLTTLGALRGIEKSDEEYINLSVDADGDLKLESVLSYVTLSSGVIQYLRVLDRQEGDMDFSYDDRSPGIWMMNALIAGSCTGMGPPEGKCKLGELVTMEHPSLNGGCAEYECLQPIGGMTDEIEMYSQTDSGTLYRLEEGKLFGLTTGDFVRTTSRQDHVDLISRAFYIANDTDRFCDENGFVKPWRGGFNASYIAPGPIDPDGYLRGSYNIYNPVETCNECFSQDKSALTCMEESINVIYIRSRIEDYRGRRWITRFADG